MNNIFKDPIDSLIQWEQHQKNEERQQIAWKTEIEQILSGNSPFMDKDALIDYLFSDSYLADLMAQTLVDPHPASQMAFLRKNLWLQMETDNTLKTNYLAWVQRSQT